MPAAAAVVVCAKETVWCSRRPADRSQSPDRRPAPWSLAGHRSL